MRVVSLYNRNMNTSLVCSAFTDLDTATVRALYIIWFERLASGNDTVSFEEYVKRIHPRAIFFNIEDVENSVAYVE